MDINQIKQLVEILEKSSLSEMEVHEGESLVRLSRHNKQIVIQENPQQINSQTTHSSFLQNSIPNITAQTSSDKKILNGFIVKSPMVGTFYSSPDPDEEPYVKIGQNITKGTILCIIEAMKMMNHIEAEESGVIGEILVADGQPVEYDQPLFTII